MQPLIAALLAVSLLSTPCLFADEPSTPKSNTKSVEGIWQGSLKVGVMELRLAFKISKKADGSLTATKSSRVKRVRIILSLKGTGNKEENRFL